MKIALVQMSMSADPADNLRKAVARVGDAKAAGADVVCLPELFRSPYFCQKEDARLTATGPRTLRVEREGRPTVDLFFDGTGWLDRLRAEWRDPATGAAAVEQWTFAGEVAAKGVRWPRRVNVSRDGVPVVDLDIFEFGIATAADLERDARPK